MALHHAQIQAKDQLVIQVQGETGLLPCQNLINNAHLSKLSSSYFEIPLVHQDSFAPNFSLLGLSVIYPKYPMCQLSSPYPHAVSRCPLMYSALLLSFSDLKDRHFQRKWQNKYMLVNIIPKIVTV